MKEVDMCVSFFLTWDSELTHDDFDFTSPVLVDDTGVLVPAPKEASKALELATVFTREVSTDATAAIYA